MYYIYSALLRYYSHPCCCQHQRSAILYAVITCLLEKFIQLRYWFQQWTSTPTNITHYLRWLFHNMFSPYRGTWCDSRCGITSLTFYLMVWPHCLTYLTTANQGINNYLFLAANQLITNNHIMCCLLSPSATKTITLPLLASTSSTEYVKKVAARQISSVYVFPSSNISTVFCSHT